MQHIFTTAVFGVYRVWITRVARYGPGEPTYKDTFLVGTFNDWSTALDFAHVGRKMIEEGSTFAPCAR